MRQNRIKEIWQQDGAALNAWLHIPDAFVAESLAHLGWDSLTVDMQHGQADVRSALAIFQAISTTTTVPFVRVPWNEPGVIMRMLDSGAYGIICPMVNDRKACEAFVGACRYPPGGYRSYGPRRAELYAGDDYVSQANETIITMAMIETVEAVRNIDSILGTPGLDALYIGPADLRQSYGPGRADAVEPAVEMVLRSAQQNRIVPGIHTGSTEEAAARQAQGFRFVTVGSDIQLLVNASQRQLAGLRGRSAEPPVAGSIY